MAGSALGSVLVSRQDDSAGNAGEATPGLFESADTIFGHLDHDRGLASPIVSAFAEDGDGLLWIGTQTGVARWDGYRMRTYQMQVGTAGSLPDNIVKTLFTDSLGRLWVGTNAGGLARYDKHHDRFVSYPEGAGILNHGRVAAIVSDGSKGLWVGTDVGLDHFDPGTGIFRHLHQGGGAAGTLEGKRVTSLVRESDGRLWVGTTSGLFESDASQKQFLPVDLETSQSSVAVLSLLRDREGALWIGTLHGAYVLRSRGSMARAVHESGGASPLDEQRVSAMAEARTGVIWLGTFGQGIVAVDTENMTTHRMEHDIALPTSLSDDTVGSLYRDREGTVWVGTRRGANSVNAAQSGIWTMFGGSSRPDGIAGADVFAVLALKGGGTWLGLSNKGVDIFDSSWKRAGTLRPDPAHPATKLPEGTVNALAETPEGKVYIGTARGLYRADGDGGGLARVPLQPDSSPRAHAEAGGDAEANVSAALYDGGRVWVGTDHGLWSVDASAHSVLTRAPLQGQLTDSRIIVLRRGQGNDLWIGTESGLNRVDLHTMAVEAILPDARNPAALGAGLITSMILDGRGRLWVGTMGGGLNVLEGRGKDGRPIFHRLTEGLLNGNIDTLLKSSDESIWVATDDGMAMMVPETFAMRTVQAADGLGILAYWNSVGTKMEDGTLLFGGVGGLTLIRPGLLKPWTYLPPVVVTEMRVNGSPTVGGDSGRGSAGDPVRIEPKNNRIAVEFAALDYTAPELNQYSYRLEGYDSDWVTTEATERVASYTNLPPGRYTLLLRGSNRAGVWGKTREVHLLVVAAWYQTVWFHVLTGVLILVLCGGVYQGATAVSRRRQRELERQVALRTTELEKTTAELRESQRRLEEMAFSDSLTGLPNRRMFTEYFRRLLRLRQRETGTFALLMFDLDGFKGINDTHGHDAGDAVLKAVAERLQKHMRETDCFARLGGDEFSILFTGPIDAAGVEMVSERIVNSFVEPVLVGDVALNVSLSIGLAFYPEGGATQEELYKAADLALYRAKRAGKNSWSW